MKNSAVIFIFVLFLFSLSAFAQKPKTAKNIAKNKIVKSVSENPPDEKEEFEKAIAQRDASERVTALQKFIAEFPESGEKVSAQELIVSGRAQIADEKLRSNNVENGIELFKLAIKGIPTPVSDKLFTEIVLQIPTNIFYRNQRSAAVDVAKLIEQKIEGNAKQLLGLATFYIGTENAGEAQRLANKAIELQPDFPAAYQTLGLAYRLNFQLEDAVTAYAKALELDNESTVSKRSLAEMKRAVGKPLEAVELYREILAKDAADNIAETGLILSLFNGDKKNEAETELAKSLERNPNNLVLLVGASYWYAAQGNGAKSIEFGQRAVEAEPRYTWAHIALARGFAVQKRPLEAERTLLSARQYGNFPTLDYELAAVRMSSGFYREAANGLKNTFSFKSGEVQTKLGGRVVKQAENFIELLAAERRASIFEPATADNIEDAQKLKSLLEFSQQLDLADLNEETIEAATDNFVSGSDDMKSHRQIYAANRLLEKRIAVPKAFELTKAAVVGVDAALNSPNATAAVLAEELYESRTLAISRNELVIVPTVPRLTLSKILRGRIEELSGWAFYQEEKPDEAITRFRRALSVLPENSSWWRNSMWRLGAALQSAGKTDEALDSYFKSYTSGNPELSKRIIIEALYQKVNGSLDGLDAKIGARPESNIAELPVQSEVVAQSVNNSQIKSSPVPEPEIVVPEPVSITLPETISPPVVETKTSLPDQNAEETVKVKEEPSTKDDAEIVSTQEVPPTPEIKTEADSTSIPMPKETVIEPTVAETAPESIKTPEVTAEKNDVKSNENQIAEVKQSQPQNLNFDPIIITVPKIEIPKKKEGTSPETESKKVLVVPNEPNEDISEEVPSEESEKTVNTIKDNLSKTRPRFVEELRAEGVQPCRIITSQESVSILNDGGSLGILVGIENGGDIKNIRSSSSDPADVEISFEPEIGALSGRAFFIVKSISQNKGIFTGIFEAPCGRKEITIKVR